MIPLPETRDIPPPTPDSEVPDERTILPPLPDTALPVSKSISPPPPVDDPVVIDADPDRPDEIQRREGVALKSLN